MFSSKRPSLFLTAVVLLAAAPALAQPKTGAPAPGKPTGGQPVAPPAVAAPAAAPAPSEAKQKEAIVHVQAAQQAVADGDHEKAIVEYEAAFAAVPNPNLLIALALEYRDAGKLDEARQRLQRFAKEAPADHPRQDEAQQLLNKFEAEAARKAEEARFEPDVIALQADDGEKPERKIKPVVPTGATLKGGLPTTEKKRRDPTAPDGAFYKTWWFWTLTAVVVGGAVAIGVIASRPRPVTIHDCPTDVIGCFGEGRR